MESSGMLPTKPRGSLFHRTRRETSVRGSFGKMQFMAAPAPSCSGRTPVSGPTWLPSPATMSRPTRRGCGASSAPPSSASSRRGREDPQTIFRLNRETSDVELDKWGREHIPGFLGVRARSQFDSLYPPGKPMQPGSSCILNLDYGDYARGGTHWVGVRVAKDAPVLMYVDSFGLPPPRDVSIRGRLEGRGVLYPDVAYQSFDEVNCGPRALAALHYLAHAKNELAAFSELGDR